ncbi:MAG: hypothetical protein NT069_06965 [Planctomycetota bacterium]|nr:hypothetical protein [Planctomycetota bacterium]
MFWPPEGLSQTANDDLYALGLTARAALTGESPADLKLTTVVPRRTALTPASRRAKTLDRFLTSTCAVEPKVRVSDETALRKLVAKRTLNQSRLLAMLGLFAMLAAVWIGVDRRRGVPMDEMPNRRNDVRVQDQRDSPDEGGEADIPAPRDYHRDYETYKHYASNLYDALDKGWVSVKTEARNQLAESAVNRFDLPEHQLHAEELERLAERIAEDGAEETRQVLQIDNATRENTAIEAVRPGDIDPDWVEIETLCGATRKFWGTNRKVVVAMKDLEVLQRSGPDLSWIIATFRLKVALSEYKRAFQLRDSRILIKDELLGDAELPGKLASAEEMFRRGFRDAEQKAHEAELALRNFYRSKEADDERWKEPLEWSPLLRRLVAIRLSS